MNELLEGKTVFITGSARRIGHFLALAAAEMGADVIIHHNNSQQDAENTAEKINLMGKKAWVVKADLSHPEKAKEIIVEYWKEKPLYALVNNAAIFESVKFHDTNKASWDMHMNINLTAPFLLSQAFAQFLDRNKGKIINILDWRALRPGKDHFPYTISKAGLASLTKSTALSLAPNIQVNAIALGAILPPADGGDDNIIKMVPAGRWANIIEVQKTFQFLLTSPEYITGEIIHIDGGRHLV